MILACHPQAHSRLLRPGQRLQEPMPIDRVRHAAAAIQGVSDQIENHAGPMGGAAQDWDADGTV